MTTKQMKVPRGTARALRRVGLIKNWRTTKGAKQMLPPAGVAVTQAITGE